jgi:hypothetical protein
MVSVVAAPKRAKNSAYRWGLEGERFLPRLTIFKWVFTGPVDYGQNRGKSQQLPAACTKHRLAIGQHIWGQ